MRLTKINNEWIKLQVSCIAVPGTNHPRHLDYLSFYLPQTQGDLNKLIKLFVTVSSVAVEGTRYSAKNFTKTYNTYAERLGYPMRYRTDGSVYFPQMETMHVKGH